MKRIKYIAYYDTIANKDEERGYVLAATNKIDYICSALNRVGFGVDIVSMSGTRGSRICPAQKIKLNESNNLYLFSTIGRGV